MYRRRFTQLGVAAIAIVASGFVVSGLSRLVVSTDAALLLGAPLLLTGFLLAILTFLLAMFATIGVVELDGEEAREA